MPPEQARVYSVPGRLQTPQRVRGGERHLLSGRTHGITESGTKNYTVSTTSGTGTIGGNAGLTKTGTGTLTLAVTSSPSLRVSMGLSA